MMNPYLFKKEKIVKSHQITDDRLQCRLSLWQYMDSLIPPKNIISKFIENTAVIQVYEHEEENVKKQCNFPKVRPKKHKFHFT